MRQYQCRRLTVDIANPQHDRRRRYGADAVASFPAGAFFTYFPTVDVPHVGRFASSAHIIIDGNDKMVSSSVADALFAASVSASPETANESLLAAGTYTHNADTVLQKLLDRCLITPQQIMDAVAAMHDE